MMVIGGGDDDDDLAMAERPDEEVEDDDDAGGESDRYAEAQETTSQTKHLPVVADAVALPVKTLTVRIDAGPAPSRPSRRSAGTSLLVPLLLLSFLANALLARCLCVRRDDDDAYRVAH